MSGFSEILEVISFKVTLFKVYFVSVGLPVDSLACFRSEITAFNLIDKLRTYIY